MADEQVGAAGEIEEIVVGLAQMRQFFGVRPEDLMYSDGQGWAIEEIKAITHTGTHVDAPYHYGPLSGGKPARRIDQVPLEWCFAPGVVLDVRHKAAGEFITVFRQLWSGEPVTFHGDHLFVEDARIVLSGYPHLEEAFSFGEGVLPILAERGLLANSELR